MLGPLGIAPQFSACRLLCLTSCQDKHVWTSETRLLRPIAGQPEADWVRRRPDAILLQPPRSRSSTKTSSPTQSLARDPRPPARRPSRQPNSWSKGEALTPRVPSPTSPSGARARPRTRLDGSMCSRQVLCRRPWPGAMGAGARARGVAVGRFYEVVRTHSRTRVPSKKFVRERPHMCSYLLSQLYSLSV